MADQQGNAVDNGPWNDYAPVASKPDDSGPWNDYKASQAAPAPQPAPSAPPAAATPPQGAPAPPKVTPQTIAAYNAGTEIPVAPRPNPLQFTLKPPAPIATRQAQYQFQGAPATLPELMARPGQAPVPTAADNPLNTPAPTLAPPPPVARSPFQAQSLEEVDVRDVGYRRPAQAEPTTLAQQAQQIKAPKTIQPYVTAPTTVAPLPTVPHVTPESIAQDNAGTEVPSSSGIPNSAPEVQAVGKQFPALGRYLNDVVIQPGTNVKGDDRQVETYAPWESENPNKGKITIQPFRPELTSGPQLTNTVAGELLHHIGGVDPSTGQPVDPQYQALKQAVIQARTPQQQALDQREYAAQQKQGEKRPFNDWLNQSRADEYIMGYVTPDADDEWRKKGFYDAPAMTHAVGAVKRYLTAPRAPEQAVAPPVYYGVGKTGPPVGMRQSQPTLPGPVAGAGPLGVPQPVAHPAPPPMQQTGIPGLPESNIPGVGLVERTAQEGITGVTQIYAGDVGYLHATTPEAKAAAKKQVIVGLTNAINTGGKVAIVIEAPELLGLAGAATGVAVDAATAAAARAALAKIALSVGIGAGTSAAAGAGAKDIKLSPEAQALAKTAGFWAGAGLGGAGIKAEPITGEYAGEGAQVRVGPYGVRTMDTPEYRAPGPTGSYSPKEGSTIVPRKFTVSAGKATPYVAPPKGPWTDYAPPPPRELPAQASQGAPSAPAEPPASGFQPSAAGAARLREQLGQRPAVQGAVPADVAPQGKPVAPAEPTAAIPLPAKTPIQGSSDTAALRASAEEQHPTLKATIQGAIANIPGAKLDSSRVKSVESMKTANQRGTANEDLKDVLGLRVAVDTPEAGKAAIAAIAQNHQVVGQEPLDANGLKGQQLFIQSGKPGDAHQVAEVQIIPAPQVKAMDKTTPIYEAQKKAEAAGNDKKAEALGDKAEEIHKEAIAPIDKVGTPGTALAAPEQPATSERQGGRGESPEQAAGVAPTQAAPAVSTSSRITTPGEIIRPRDIPSSERELPAIKEGDRVEYTVFGRRVTGTVVQLGKSGETALVNDGHQTVKHALADLEVLGTKPAKTMKSANPATSTPAVKPPMLGSPYGPTVSALRTPEPQAEAKPAPSKIAKGSQVTLPDGKVSSAGSSIDALASGNGGTSEIRNEFDRTGRRDGENQADRRVGLRAAQPNDSAFSTDNMVFQKPGASQKSASLEIRSRTPHPDAFQVQAGSEEMGGESKSTSDSGSVGYTRNAENPRAGAGVDRRDYGPTAQIKIGSNVITKDSKFGTVKWMKFGKARISGPGAPRDPVPVADLKLSEPITGTTSGTPGHDVPTPGAIAEDLDNTMAAYKEGDYQEGKIGAPIKVEVARVKQMLADGKDVWVYSSRAKSPEDVTAMKAWTKEHLGQKLPVTNVKYGEFSEFRDDKGAKPAGGTDGESSASGSSVAKAEGSKAEAKPAGGAGELEGKAEASEPERGTASGGGSEVGRAASEPRPERPAAEAAQEVAKPKSALAQKREKFKAKAKPPAVSAEPPVPAKVETPAKVGSRVTVSGGKGGLFGNEAGFLDIKPAVDRATALLDDLNRHREIADTANATADILRNLGRVNKTTEIDSNTIVRKIKAAGFTPEDDKALYRHGEDPSVELTPKQQGYLDKWVKPLADAAAERNRIVRLINEANKTGKFTVDDVLSGNIPPEVAERFVPRAENYMHRIPADKRTMATTLLGESKRNFKAGGAALSKAYSSAKKSVFYEIRGPNGEREAVAVKGGRVTQLRPGTDGGKSVATDLGAFRSGLTDAGKETDERMMPFVQRITELRDEIAGIPEADRTEQLASVQDRIAELKRQMALLDKVKAPVGKTQVYGGKTMYTREPTFGQRAAISRKLDDLYKREERLKNKTEPMLSKNQKKMEARKEELKGNEDFRDNALMEGEKFEGSQWRDKNGQLWKFNRGTTQFISERTGQQYHESALLSTLINYRETDKAMNAAIVTEKIKGMLEDEGLSLKTDNPASVPDGWKGTTLMQMRGHYFPAHIADALDQFDSLQSRGAPNILSRANSFMLQTVLMNPLMHGKNTAANWFIGKAAEAITGHAFQPKWYGDNIRAGMKAVNLLREMGGAEYNRLLRLGLDLQCKSDYMDQTSRDFLRGLVEQLGQDKESNRAMSVLMAVPDAAKWLKRTNHTLTFGMNDLFLAQSFYARQAELIAKGMSPDLADMAARDWAHQQVVEYMTPIRMMGSAPLGRAMENQNIALFMRYRFGGKIRPLMNAVKEAIGSFKPDENMTEAMGGALGRTTDTASGQQEETYGERNARGQTRAEARTNAIARLAVMIGMAAYIYPKLDRIAKRITHDAQAKFPLGGAMEDVVHVAESLKGERSWGATASADFSLALATEEILELIANRDFYTWHHIRGTNVGTEDQTMQLASWLGSKTMPGQMTHRWDQGRGKQVLFGLLGFTFPMEHGVKEAAEVRSDKSGSNPAPPQAEKVWQSILAASEQAQRSGGKDTRLEDALLASGKLTKSQEDELQDAVYDPPIVFAVNGMNGQEVWRVYGKSTDEEKRQLLDDDKIYEKLSEYGDSLRDNEDDKTADAIDKELTASH